MLKNEIVYTTNSYKYLGFVITPSGEITSGLKDLKDRALRAYYTLNNRMGHYFKICPSTTSTLRVGNNSNYVVWKKELYKKLD